MKGINSNTKIGDKVTMFNTVYEVTNIYQVSDVYMKKYNLVHRNRITLKKLKGKGQEKLDFAIV